jgi:hypothetical protein
MVTFCALKFCKASPVNLYAASAAQTKPKIATKEKIKT